MNSPKPSDLTVSRISTEDQPKIHAFLASIFSAEQDIPVDKIPVNSKEAYWWGITGPDSEILGAVATWKEEDGYHWGRFCIHPKIRGLGLGKKLAAVSLAETFELGITQLRIDARDAIIRLIQGFGGSICGEPTHFYSENVTPMVLEKKNFSPG